MVDPQAVPVCCDGLKTLARRGANKEPASAEGGAHWMTSSLDRRSMIVESGWHWGDGVQHEIITDLPALQQELIAHSGIKGLEIVDPAESGYVKKAAKLFHRDGFCCIKDVLTPAHLAALRKRCEDAMHSIVAQDEFGGAKGAWRYMFGGSSLTGSCMHFPEYAQLSSLSAVDAVLTEIWGTPEFTCYVRVHRFVV